MLLPFYQPKQAVNGTIVFAGDVGATKTNLALYRIENNNYHLLQETKLVSKDYNNITELTRQFMRDAPKPDAICFGVAGPVLNGHATLSNLKWEIDIKEITAQYPGAGAYLINDLKATAYGLAVLEEKDVKIICEGSAAPAGNAAIIAPGTGLGEAGLYWDGKYFHPFATEGGHADFAARNSLDFELYTFLQMRNADEAAIISEHAEQSTLCKTTMQHFVRYLAFESANLVLKLNATGGLFIGGGIAPQIIHLLENDAFYTSFRQSGRLNFLLEKVPVKIILNTKTALLGAAYYAATQ